MQKNFVSLTAFRGIYAILVIIYHLNLYSSIVGLPFFRNTRLLVDFFFVLSGFVMNHIYGSREYVSVKSFIVSRAFRFFPLHIFMFLVFFAMELFKYARPYLGIDHGQVPFTGLYAFDEIIPNLLLIQAWSMDFKAGSFNTVSWSISVLFYTYILFILTVRYAKKYKECIWFAIFLLVYLSRVYQWDLVTVWVARGLTGFFLGALFYTLRKKLQNICISTNIYSMLEVVIIGVIILFVCLKPLHSDVYTIFIYAFTVLVFSYDKGCVSRYFQKHIFQYLGKLSYSIYMVHFAVTILMIDFFALLHKIEIIEDVNFNNVFINNTYSILCIVVSVYISRYTYAHVEMKYTMPPWIKKRLEAKR